MPAKPAKPRNSDKRLPSQTLQSMLALEAKLDYQDKAVAGGLDAYLRNILSSGEQDQFFKRIIAALPQAGYASLSPQQRRAWAQRGQRAAASRRRNDQISSRKLSARAA